MSVTISLFYSVIPCDVFPISELREPILILMRERERERESVYVCCHSQIRPISPVKGGDYNDEDGRDLSVLSCP